jgi:hypothetical protein
MISLDNLYDHLGSYYFLDFFHIFIVTPVTFTGLILNIITMFILTEKRYFKPRFYKYLWIICLKNAIRNLFSIVLMFLLARRYFEFASSYCASIFLAHIITPLVTTLFLFNSLVDLWITLEKLVQFKPVYNRLLMFSPTKTSVILFAFSILINFPTYFKLTSANLTVLDDASQNTTKVIYYVQYSSFSKSLIGSRLLFTVVIFRSIMILLILIVFELIIMKILRVYFKQRVTMICRKDLLDKNQSIQVCGILFRQSSQYANNDSEYFRTRNQITFKVKRLAKAEAKTFKIIIAFCTATFLEHIFFVVVNLCAAYFGGMFLQVFTSLGIFYSTLKNASNFFILYRYNVIFRRIVLFHLRKFKLV